MTLAKAKLASSITFIVLASFTIVTYDHENMFIIQATGIVGTHFFVKNQLANRHSAYTVYKYSGIPCITKWLASFKLSLSLIFFYKEHKYYN